MSTLLMVVIVVVVVAIVAGAGFLVWSQARTQRLRRQFGPEYDRAIDSHPNRREAERDLQSREQRHQELDIRTLDPQARERYQQQWTQVQEHFVDAPEAAVEQADRLVIVVMGERGYPTQDFDERVATLSVEHGRMLDHYRRGHDISLSAGRKEASTEELRQAMVHYRALFEDLLAVPAGQAATNAPAEPAQATGTSEPAVRDQGVRDETVRDEAASGQAAADQAAADRTAADRTATDRTATDRATTDQTAADRTATDGTASDQSAADRAADAGDDQVERERAEGREARTDAVTADPRERGPRSGSN